MAAPRRPDQTDPMYADEVRDRLRSALRQAMKDRDQPAVAGLRSAIASIDNAEAVQPGALEMAQGPIAGARTGLRAAEAARRELTPAEVTSLIQAEVDDRRTTADEYAAIGQHEAADRLRAEAAALCAQLTNPAAEGS